MVVQAQQARRQEHRRDDHQGRAHRRRHGPDEEGPVPEGRRRDKELDQKLIDRARALAGLKGYVTNLPTEKLSGADVIAAYHDLYKVEASFRMVKSDLRARPIFHHEREAIEAHLTVVFAALAVSRHLQAVTGMSIKKLVKTLRKVRSGIVEISGQRLSLDPVIPADAQAIIDAVAKQGH